MTGGKIDIEIDEAVWGALQGYTMPMESVYYLSCASDEGYAVPASYCSDPWRLLSDRALACGRRHGDVLYFSCETHDSMPVEYELCLWRTQRAWDPRMEAALEAQLESCRLYGMVDCPAYFGPYPAPQWMPQGGADRALSLETASFGRSTAASAIWPSASPSMTPNCPTRQKRRGGWCGILSFLTPRPVRSPFLKAPGTIRGWRP